MASEAFAHKNRTHPLCCCSWPRESARVLSRTITFRQRVVGRRERDNVRIPGRDHYRRRETVAVYLQRHEGGRLASLTQNRLPRRGDAKLIDARWRLFRERLFKREPAGVVRICW